LSKSVQVTEIVPYSRNSRTHSPEQIAQIAASIRQFGFTNPVLIDEANVLIAGHGRLAAAQRLGMTEVPAIVVAGLSETDRQALRIADNKLALNAGWDDDLLLAELTELRDVGFDLALTGFGDAELTDIFAEHNDGLTDPDDVPEPPAEPVSRLGDVWLLGRHRLVCGDATDAADVALCLGGVKPHLMVTDPPYGVEYDPHWRAEVGVNKNRGKMGVVTNDARVDWTDAWALAPCEVAYVWHAGRHASAVQASIEAVGFEIRCQIIWAKDRFALSRGHYHWQHEPCWYAVKGVGHWSGDRSQSTLWNIASRDDSGHGHSTQKPVECMKRPIENNSSAGQAVYDPFCGSGTTIIAAEMTGRACHAIEISPAYVDVCVLRWQAFTGMTATRLDGTPFGATHAKADADQTAAA
jgi:DNA modification methylase